MKSGKWFGASKYLLWMTQKPMQGDFWEVKSKKISRGSLTKPWGTMAKAPGPSLCANLFSYLSLICLMLLFRSPRVALRKDGRHLAAHSLRKHPFLLRSSPLGTFRRLRSPLLVWYFCNVKFCLVIVVWDTSLNQRSLKPRNPTTKSWMRY